MDPILDFGSKNPELDAANVLVGGYGFAEGAGTLAFWLLVIPYLLTAIVYTGVSVHMVPMATDRGSRPQTALALSVVGIASLVSRFITGILLERVHYDYQLRPVCRA
jgi:hypothetical protein